MGRHTLPFTSAKPYFSHNAKAWMADRNLKLVDRCKYLEHLKPMDRNLKRVDRSLKRVDRHLKLVDRHLKLVDRHLKPMWKLNMGSTLKSASKLKLMSKLTLVDIIQVLVNSDSMENIKLDRIKLLCGHKEGLHITPLISGLLRRGYKTQIRVSGRDTMTCTTVLGTPGITF